MQRFKDVHYSLYLDKCIRVYFWQMWGQWSHPHAAVDLSYAPHWQRWSERDMRLQQWILG